MGNVDTGADTGTDSTGSFQVFVVKLAPDRTATTTNLQPGVFSASVLAPDRHGGVLVQYIDPNSGQNMILDTTSGVAYPDPLGGTTSAVVSETGLACGNAFSSIACFDPLSGPVQWSYQSPTGVSSMDAIHGGGLLLFDTGQNQVALDPQGNAAAPVSLGALQTVQVSLKGALYGVPSGGGLELISAPLVDWADGGWDGQAGGPKGEVPDRMQEVDDAR